MTKLYVDFSLALKGKSLGQFSGYVQLPIVPQIGDTISLNPSPTDSFAIEEGAHLGFARVENRIFRADGSDDILISLSTIELNSEKHLDSLIKMLEEKYGLLWIEY